MLRNIQQFVTRQGRKPIGLLLIVFCMLCSPASAQIGTWRNYLSYHEVQDICAADQYLFVLASNGLYQYNKNDQSITTYDKANGLSDTYITHIAWCQQAKRLIAVYEDSNIDLVETNGSITNISSIYSKTFTGDKTLNSIYIYEQYAYLACGFGIVKLDVKNAEISETYMFNHSISNVAIKDNYIYAEYTNEGNICYVRSLLSNNLLDIGNWESTTGDLSSLFTDNKSDYEQNISLVETLKPGGPKYNHFFYMKVYNGKLYTVGGGFYQFDNFQRPGTVQVWNNNNWTIYQDDIKPAFADRYLDVTSIAIDPRDENHVIVASCSGLYEFRNEKFVKNHTAGNTDYFESAASNNSPAYVRTNGVIYDKEGNLYCLNSGSTTGIIKWDKDGEWNGIMDDALIDEPNHALRVMKNSIIDSRGILWFVNAHSDNPYLYSYNPENDVITKYINFVNQDGTKIANHYSECVCEDTEGNIWVGTDVGPVYLDKERIQDNSLGVIQYKVPRNDGSNYADYLLANNSINCMAIDGGGRKWFGTANDGVYLISFDNNTQLQHFTIENSSLLSNTIESIAINNETGEVFFGTDKGLCSYVSDATVSNTEMNSDNVLAYPNPVEPGYTGLITVTGLSFNADVKILSSNGALIKEGRSNGGTFIWDGKDKNGKSVASGIYMVATATSDGKKGIVCKIAVVK